METKWLTVTQAAEYLQVNYATVIRWIKAGKLAAGQMPGGGYRIDAATLDTFLEPAKVTEKGAW